MAASPMNDQALWRSPFASAHGCTWGLLHLARNMAMKTCWTWWLTPWLRSYSYHFKTNSCWTMGDLLFPTRHSAVLTAGAGLQFFQVIVQWFPATPLIAILNNGDIYPATSLFSRLSEFGHGTWRVLKPGVDIMTAWAPFIRLVLWTIFSCNGVSIMNSIHSVNIPQVPLTTGVSNSYQIRLLKL